MIDIVLYIYILLQTIRKRSKYTYITYISHLSILLNPPTFIFICITHHHVLQYIEYSNTMKQNKNTPPKEHQNIMEEDNIPNPWEQIDVIALFTFFYLIQGVLLQIPGVLGTYMAHEVHECEDKYYVQTYLDNVFWPFSLKLLIAPIVDFIPLFCFSHKFHRRGYMLVASILSAVIFFVLTFTWSFIDPDDSCPNAPLLFAHLFPIILINAIADVALDGSAVLALQGKNIGYFALIQTLGYTFGSSGGEVAFIYLEQRIGVRSCFTAIGIVSLISACLIFKAKENDDVDNNNSDILIDDDITNNTTCNNNNNNLKRAYKELYRIVTNQNALFIAIAFYASALFWGEAALLSKVDLRNLGYTKDDVAIVGIIDALPTAISIFLITQYIGARVDGIKRLKILYPICIIGWISYFCTMVIPPYMDGTTNGNGKETWVFPFRTIVNLIGIPFRKVVYILIISYASRITPTSCPGTFITVLMTFMNLGSKIWKSIRNPIRNAFQEIAKEHNNGICDGTLNTEYQGKYIFTETIDGNTTKQVRFCGKVNCEVNEYCNKLGDGYVLFGIFSLCIGIIYYILFVLVIARKIDIEKEKFDPNNVEERIKWCPRKCCGEDMYHDDYNEYLSFHDDDIEEDIHSRNNNHRSSRISYVEMK